MKPKCPDCPHNAIGRLPEYNYDGYCMMVVETDYGSDTPIFVKCNKVGIVGKALGAWYIEAFGVKP